MKSQPSPGCNRLFVGVFLGLLALSMPGCAPTGKVAGTVKYQGKLLTAGNVIFVDGANRATPPALIHADGTYLVPSVPIGLVTILIQVPPPRPPETREDDGPQWQDYRARLEAFMPLPERYMDLKNSGQTFEVKSGDNVCNLELE